MVGGGKGSGDALLTTVVGSAPQGTPGMPGTMTVRVVFFLDGYANALLRDASKGSAPKAIKAMDPFFGCEAVTMVILGWQSQTKFPTQRGRYRIRFVRPTGGGLEG